MVSPTFSVVIPSYNRRPLLAEAVASVRAQTFEDWDLVIVDDGSDDGTAGDYAPPHDPRIRFVQLPHTGIVGQVRNEGVRRTTGRYLAFLDSDDLWRPDKLEHQRAALERTGATWSMTGYDVIDPAGPGSGTRVLRVHTPDEPQVDSDDLLVGLLTTEISAAMSSLVIERAAFDRLGGFPTHPRVREDHDLVLRLAEAREPAVAVPETLMSIRHHGKRSDHGERDPFDRSALAYELFLERHRTPGIVSARALRAARARLAYHRIHSARIDHRHGDHAAAREKLWQVWNPGWRSPRWWLAWLG